MAIAPALAKHFFHEEEYWALEDAAETKHEWFDGEIFAMPRVSPEHCVVAANAGANLGSQLRGTTCRIVGSDQQVRVEATGLITYPDLVVYCEPYRFEPRHPNTLLNPLVIIEVLSPSTANYDRTAKLDNYRQIASLQDVLLIEPERVRVEWFHRLPNDQWLHHVETTLENAITLHSINCTLALNEIYQTIELPDETPLRTMQCQKTTLQVLAEWFCI